jgi:hypothetical protein
MYQQTKQQTKRREVAERKTKTKTKKEKKFRREG